MFQLSTIPRARSIYRNCRIKAITVRAIRESTQLTIRDDAAVATIPVTAAIIVFVVTVLVSLVLFESAAALAALCLLGGVGTFAIVAKPVVVAGPTAISPVPVARTDVVEIVAVAVLLIIREFAVGFWRAGA